MQRRPFGATPAGEPVHLWTWTNAYGAAIAISEMGATLVTLEAPDREGRLADLVLGFDSAEAYAANGLYAGAVVGRFANRIAGAAFTLDGRRHALTPNAPPHCLHGGVPGLHQKRWRAEPSPCGRALRLSVASPAGEAGFPGAMQATADYRWADDDTLELELTAIVDQPCPVSLAPHPYWNLDGHSAPTIADHHLQIAADAYTPTRPDLIPDGAVAPLPDRLNFRKARPLGAAIADLGQGLDHNFVLQGPDESPNESPDKGPDKNKDEGQGLKPAARLWSPRSGRRLTLSTDRPGLQVYTLNACPPALTGVKAGGRYHPHGAVALEPQAFPDSPNQPAFPSTILRPGEVFRTLSHFAFDVANSAAPPHPQTD